MISVSAVGTGGVKKLKKLCRWEAGCQPGLWLEDEGWWAGWQCLIRLS
jgi:hypothetical protein